MSKRSKNLAYASAHAEEAAARKEIKKAERDVLEAEPRIAEAARRFMSGDASAAEAVREASADLSAKHRRLGEALARQRIAEHRYKTIGTASKNPGDPPPGVYEWDSKKFPHPPDSYEIAEWRGGPRARKGNRPLIRINPCGTKNPAPSSIARGGKKLEELERALGSATFIFRASETEDNRRAVHRAMKALETYRKKVGINPIENPSRKRKVREKDLEEFRWTIPGQAVLLGEAVELEVISDKGRRRTFKGGGAAALLSDVDGDALAIVRPDATEKADPRRGSKDAASTWRKWSGFHVDGALLLTVTDRPLKFSLGRVTVIRYRSDKWTGKAAYYEHKFESKDFHVWADSASSPRAILITAFPPRRLVTARGIVG